MKHRAVIAFAMILGLTGCRDETTAPSENGSPPLSQRSSRSLKERTVGPLAAEATARLGSLPYVTILCKFSDIADEPFPMATYKQWTTGTTYPSLDHYWRELSYNQMNVSGSVLVGWYTLPFPLSHYVTEQGVVDRISLTSDCTSAADPDVDFPKFWGINQQFNGNTRGSAASVGPTWTLTADGQTKTYAMTWLYPWNSLADYAHEDGHALGLPHSNGWDIMGHGSGIKSCTGLGIPVHTISWNKDVLGWIPAARKLTVGPNTSKTITLERLALPGSGNYLMAQIPMENAPGQFYTVEVRRRAGYDDCLPGDAAILYRVNPSSGTQPAQMVDGDGNGNLLDAGAMWTPGETFTDQANRITVTIDAQTTTGFQVTIRRGASNTWLGRKGMAKARSAFSLTAASNLLYAVGGRSNGTILASVEAYNPASNTWVGKAAVPSARYDGNGAALAGANLYLPGGRNSAGTLTRTLYAYNLSTNAWSTKAALPILSGCGASATINGLIYVLTGCDGTSWYKSRLHRYTPATNTWSTRATAPAGHGYPAIGVINGKLYVAGGKNAAGVATATLHVYDPTTNVWTTKAAMPSARFGAAGQVINGKLYVVGGTNASGGVLGATLVYNPATNLWSTKASMSTARTGLASAVVNNQLYAVGGRVTTDVTKVEQYTP